MFFLAEYNMISEYNLAINLFQINYFRDIVNYIQARL